MSLELSAGGTLERCSPSLPRRIWLATEVVILFVAAPLAMWFAVHRLGIPLFLALGPLFAIAVLMLLADRTFSLKRECVRGIDRATLLSIVIVFAIGAAIATAFVIETRPRAFLEFPTNRPETWARIMLLYPFASVLAQEIIYRTFFFHRYGVLFGSYRGLGVLTNGALFGFGHIVIGQSAAIFAAAAAGLLFAQRYAGTRSFWAVVVEHTLWGWMVFTVGLGRYFFTGVSNI